MFGRKSEEYVADFCLIAKRTLTGELEYKIFRFHYLLGADYTLCCRRLNMDRGTFFHAIYRIQEKLGRAFRETQPYGIFPLDEYFGNTVRTRRAAAAITQPPADAGPVHPPVHKVA
jgi:hypothetical protein